MDDTSPTTSCEPIYREEYFIFDREDLRSVSGNIDGTSRLTSVRNVEGSTIMLYASETRTVTVSRSTPLLDAHA